MQKKIASSNLYGVSRAIIRYRMKEKEEWMKFTNILSTFTLRQGKVTLIITRENEILDFLYRAFGNVVTGNHIIYKLWI